MKTVFRKINPDIKRRRLVLAAVFVWMLACVSGTSRAHFEREVPSARTSALGGTFVSVADDPSAITANPAGLALADTMGLLLTYQKPYGLSDLNGGFAAFALPTRVGVFGFSWQYLGLSGVMTESVFSLGYARYIIKTSQDASLSVGATVDYKMAASEYTATRDGFLTGGLGVLLRPFPMIGIGYSIRNVIPGDIDLLSGGPATELKYQQAWALSYRWNNRVRFSFDRRQDTYRVWRNHAGLEINTFPNLHLRAGINRTSLTGGFGLFFREFRLDVGVVSHEQLGPTYQFSIGWLPKVKRAYVQAQ